MGPDPYTVDVCPGWLVRQPAITETAELLDAAEGGWLDRRDPFNLRIVNRAVSILRRAYNLYTSERNKVLQQRMERS